MLTSSTSDLALALRARNMADFNLTDASDQFDVAVKDMYITGTTDVDVILGVLGSKPEDVLRTIDSVVYLRTATGTESADFDFAASAAVVAQSAAASVMIQASEDRGRVDTVLKALRKTKKELKKDQKELKKLISVAAPADRRRQQRLPEGGPRGHRPRGRHDQAAVRARRPHGGESAGSLRHQVGARPSRRAVRVRGNRSARGMALRLLVVRVPCLRGGCRAADRR